MIVRLSALFAVAVLIVAQVGCGGAPDAGATVSGKVLKGGQPLKADMGDGGPAPPGSEDDIAVSLFPVGDGVEVSGLYNTEDGSVEFANEGGTPPGVAPGKYKLVVTVHPGGDYDKDALDGVFNMENSPVEIEVPESAKGGSFDMGTIELNDHASEN